VKITEMSAIEEREIAKKITSFLDVRLHEINPPYLIKLSSARATALGAYREPIRLLGLVSVSGRITDPTYVLRQPLVWLPIIAIAAAAFVFSPSATDDVYDESGSVDAKLLTGELPIDAFLDKDFATWVKEKEESASQ